MVCIDIEYLLACSLPATRVIIISSSEHTILEVSERSRNKIVLRDSSLMTVYIEIWSIEVLFKQVNVIK